MWLKTNLLLLFFTLLISDYTSAQDIPATADSTSVYQKIENYSKKRKFTKFIYRIIFKPVVLASPKKKGKKIALKKPTQKSYKAFEGKIIRQINIETLDPFGYSLSDTGASPNTFLYKAGNKLHNKSRQLNIRNLLLIRKNQVFDSLRVKESERLVRRMAYIKDVKFTFINTEKNSDSVDVTIRVMDKWSIIPKISISTTNTNITLTDKNFIGLGHESKNGLKYNQSKGKYAYDLNYYIPNLRNTYINTNVHFNSDEFRNYTKSLAFDRPFFSPLAKWAAGVNFSRQFSADSVLATDSVMILQRHKLSSQDYWLGNAIQIFKGSSENDRTTNFISTLRYLRIRYPERPVPLAGKEEEFPNEDFYLGSIGISTRKYMQDQFVFQYGFTEDVPVGQVYSITGGYQVRNNTGRIYLSAKASHGKYYSWGYLSSSYEYGTFFRSSHAEQSTFTAGLIYFTGLLESGNWKFRQFIKPQITLGINRFENDSLTLHEGNGIDGFNSTTLTGTRRLLLTFQTQSYAPWNIIGFRFGPYLTYSMGMLGETINGFKNSRLYSQIGIGILVRNEYLVFSTFQFSIAFYPLIPGQGKNIFKINSFKAADFGFRDFEIGKPATVVFQ